MKKMGRAHRHFFRICATDKRSPRDGRVLEELGTYDPMVPDADARVQLKRERVDYWIGVGATPSEKVAILLKKYGTGGTHLDAQRAALEKLSMPAEIPDAGEPVSTPQSAEEAAAAEAPAEEATAEAPAEDAPAADEAPAEEAKAEEAKPEEAKAE
ncbi:30S ribosomal protein S16 [Botrimarina colliarenosi]